MGQEEVAKLPRAFVMRRLHSLLGLWLVIYLFQHLLVNSQAALFFHDNGAGFVALVNKLESIPYLKVVEALLLGIPFLIHGVWGMYYAWQGKLNAHCTDGTKPELPQYKRNKAYSWQRITSWILVVGILAHVVHMRFLAYPTEQDQSYIVKITNDSGLANVAEKLNVKLQPAKAKKVIATSPNAGGAFYLLVRDTFKSPLMVILYSLLVITAAYHAFQGLWTFMISWGVTLSAHAQKRMRTLSNILMCIVIIMGLMATWGTYWTVQSQV